MMMNKSDSRSKMNSYDYYNANEYTVPEESAKGELMEIKCEMRKLPQLIVKQWVANVLAEDPVLTYKSKVDKDEWMIDLKSILAPILAYGEVFVHASYDERFGITYNILNRYANEIKFNSNDYGFIDYITYKTKRQSYDAQNDKYLTINEVHNHKYDNDTMTYTHEIINKNDSVVETTTKKGKNVHNLMPKLFENKSFNSFGKSVFYDAISFINAFDDTLNDNDNDRMLSKPILLLPGYMLKSSASLKDGGFDMTDEYLGFKQLFRIMPGAEDSELKPIEWRGSWNPDSYITYINFLLHMISLQCGFGEKYFSYDANAGLKTATEIVSEKDDMYKNKKLFDNILKDVILWSNAISDVLMFDGELKTDIENIVFSDSIISDDDKKRDLLFKDYSVGAVDKLTYLELAGYSQENIDKIMERLNEENDTNDDLVNTYPEDNE